MGNSYTFELRTERDVTVTSVHQLLYVLVSGGTTYNEGEFPGNYIIHENQDGETGYTRYTEPDCANERVERLPEIVSKYSEHDLHSVSLTIGLADLDGHPIHYSFRISPGVDRRTRYSLISNTTETEGPQDFLRLVGHVEELCRRFDIEYAGYRTEHENLGSYPWDDGIRPESLQAVTYYASEYVEAFGRERLLSLPASEVCEHDDGGVFIVVTADPSNEYDAIRRARKYLSD